MIVSVVGYRTVQERVQEKLSNKTTKECGFDANQQGLGLGLRAGETLAKRHEPIGLCPKGMNG